MILRPSPLFVIISATSPLVIIPAPIFRLSSQLNLQAFATVPQPMTLLSIATITKPIEKSIMLLSMLSKLVFSPIPTKKIGANIM